MVRFGIAWKKAVTNKKQIMKNIVLTFILSCAGTLSSFAQTAVGKQTVANASTVLDFGTGTSKGIILPAVEALPAIPANGTFLFDATDERIKMYEDGSWRALSATGDNSNVVAYKGTVDTGKQTVMGARSTTVDGVLVLESANKAVVLPHIANPHLTVKSPYPGMMCYDTTSKTVAVFNGTVWSYWK